MYRVVKRSELDLETGKTEHHTEDVSGAVSAEVESGCLLLSDQLGRVVHAVAPDRWVEAYRVEPTQ